MLQKATIIMVLLLLASSGCRKKSALPVETNESPVFFFSGKINGELLEREAGDDGYYMFSSHHQQANGIYQFQADLRREDASSDFEITFKINDVKVSEPGGISHAGEALRAGQYLLRNKTSYPNSRFVKFIPRKPYNFESFDWEIYSHPDSSQNISAYSTGQQLLLHKTYSVVLEYDDNVGACQSRHQNVFRVGNPFQATVTAQPGNAVNSFHFKANTDVAGQYSFFWDFGDGSQSQLAEPLHVYADDQSRTVRLLLVSSKMDSCFVYYQTSSGNGYSCHANFDAVFDPLDFKDLFKTMVIELKDPEGRVYSSELADQPSGTFAEVTSISEYVNNRNGEKTRKLSVNFNCLLKGPDKDVRITDAQAVIAVSYR